MDRETLEAKRHDLQEEQVRGQRILTEQQAAVDHTKATLLRIDGAITVLDQLLAASTPPEQEDVK